MSTKPDQLQIELFDEVQGHFVETLSVVGLEPVLESNDAVSLRDAAGTEAMRYSQRVQIAC